jgi:hypothetical protein
MLLFDEFPKQRNYKLRNSQVNCKTPSIYLFVAGFQFREEFLLLQLKYDLLIGGQDHRAYSFPNARNREDAAQRLQRFVHWKVSFEKFVI